MFLLSSVRIRPTHILSCSIEASYYSFCDNSCANSTLGWGAPSSQFTLPNTGGVDPNYLYPQSLAKQLAPYNTSNTWSAEDISIELNHDAYMTVVDLDAAYSNGWNGTGIPPGGHFWFQVCGKTLLYDCLGSLRRYYIIL
jgi:hypothetical protein